MNGTARGTVTSANVVSARVSCADIGRFADMLNSESSNVSGWSIDAATGALAALTRSPFPFPASSIHPNGRFAYAAGGRVSASRVDANTGALEAVVGSPFAAGVEPRSASIDANGRFLYVANGGNYHSQSRTDALMRGRHFTTPVSTL